MIRIIGRLMAFACVFAATSAMAGEDARLWTYKYVLATSTAEPQIAPVLDHMQLETRLRPESMVDFLAEALLADLDDPNYSGELKFALLEFLGDTGGPRYRTVIERVAHGPFFSNRNPKNPKNSQKLAQKLLKKWKKQDEQYAPGTIDIPALRKQYVDAALAAQPSDELARKLTDGLNANSSIQDMFALAGTPQHVVSGETRTGDHILIYIKIQRLAFYYRGVGRVVFGYRANEGWLFQAVVADAMAFESLMPYRVRAAELGQPGDADLALRQLLSGHTAATKFVLETVNRSGRVPAEFLDTTAELLVKEHASARDPYAVDAYAWMCRILTTYGGARYADVLAKVGAATRDEKLRRFAALPMEKPADGANMAPYVEGTISLAAQRAKYPTLYPERTFTSGHL